MAKRTVVYKKVGGAIVAQHDYDAAQVANADWLASLAAAGLDYVVADGSNLVVKLKHRSISTGTVTARSTVPWDAAKFPRWGRLNVTAQTTAVAGETVNVTFEAQDYDGVADTGVAGQVSYAVRYDDAELESGVLDMIAGTVTKGIKMPVSITVEGGDPRLTVSIKAGMGTRLSSGHRILLKDDS